LSSIIKAIDLLFHTGLSQVCDRLVHNFSIGAKLTVLTGAENTQSPLFVEMHRVRIGVLGIGQSRRYDNDGDEIGLKRSIASS
jgi:hypothetical protein